MGRMKELYIEEQWGQDMRNAPQAADQNPERRVTADGFLDTLRDRIAAYRHAIKNPDGEYLPDIAAEVTDSADALDKILVAGAGLPRAWQPNAPAGLTVHIFEWDHRGGNDVSVHLTEEGALRAKADVARRFWGAVAGREGVPATAPEDDAEAARIYFDAQGERETEWGYTYVSTIQQ